MRNSEWEDNSPLCCCEYYSIEQERSHLLGCCCNCQDLDEGFESLITGDEVSPNRKSAIMATLQDRIRIPWRGGAKQITADTLIPVFFVPIAIFTAAFDLILTVLILVLIPLFLNHTYLWFRSNLPKSKFFVIWALMSLITIALIFEIKVISLLEILPGENIALGILTALFAFCVYRVRISAQTWQPSGALVDDIETNGEDFCVTCKTKFVERMQHCNVCQVCVPEKGCHFIWYDCCIGQTNRRMFLLSLIFAIASLLYSSNLTLTTVCHPFTVFETIMLPDDCSDVYEQYDMALCFVTAVYSILMASYLAWIFLREILIISLGLTLQEWLQLPFGAKLCLGVTYPRPYSLGFCRNWLKVLCNLERYKKNAYINT